MAQTDMAQTRLTTVTAPNDLESYWLPFTPNRSFKRSPRLIVRAKDMHYYGADNRALLDGTAARREWPSPMLPALERLLDDHTGDVHVVASGDPLLHVRVRNDVEPIVQVHEARSPQLRERDGDRQEQPRNDPRRRRLARGAPGRRPRTCLHSGAS